MAAVCLVLIVLDWASEERKVALQLRSQTILFPYFTPSLLKLKTTKSQSKLFWFWTVQTCKLGCKMMKHCEKWEQRLWIKAWIQQLWLDLGIDPCRFAARQSSGVCAWLCNFSLCPEALLCIHITSVWKPQWPQRHDAVSSHSSTSQPQLQDSCRFLILTKTFFLNYFFQYALSVYFQKFGPSLTL